MPDLYIANKNYSSWSLRPWVLMQVLDIPFNEHRMPFRGGAGESREDFLRFSPSGLVPCLVDGDIAVWDSLAIIEYVAEQHPRAWPKDTAARAWARSASAEMHSGFATLRNECPMNCGVRVALDEISASLGHDIQHLDERWQEGLARFGGPFLAGQEFTAVDAFYAPVVFRVQTFGLPLSEAASAYIKRMLALPAMQAWYQAALNEQWREPAHEADTIKHGTVTADYRSA